MEQANLIIWLVAFVIFAIAEAATTQMISIWFSVASLFSFIAALLDTPFWVQAVIFVAASLILLLLTRPLCRKLVNKKLVPTNADGIIGQTGMVTETIDNFLLTGRVVVAGLEWTARSEENQKIPKGTAVTVLRIEGVKVIVRPQNEESVSPRDRKVTAIR